MEPECANAIREILVFLLFAGIGFVGVAFIFVAILIGARDAMKNK